MAKSGRGAIAKNDVEGGRKIKEERIKRKNKKNFPRRPLCVVGTIRKVKNYRTNKKKMKLHCLRRKL